jgi:ribonuclease BN (tRNA processing enzyme)
MKVRILGCSGGIGGRHLRTTSIQVDHDILIDCGTGVADLSIAELAQIDHVFLTHSHLDHIACLPLMVDTAGDMRSRPLTVHATEATLKSCALTSSIGPSGRTSARFPRPRSPSCASRRSIWGRRW